MTQIRLNLEDRSYDITVGKGILSSADKYFKLDRRVFIVTDSNVPKEYAETVAGCCKEAKIYTVPEGEGSKSLATLESLLTEMMLFGMKRGDAAIAVGGGVVGDLTGFAAAVYMRGIDFYNVPTTLLSQVDSSIGGKTAVNLGGAKNTVGAFHQPKAVLIDTDVLKTLPKRQISAGLAEALKMSMTSDAELFAFFENEEISDSAYEHIITHALMIKKKVVEIDEKETGLRKILNFGHTLGHGIEAASGFNTLYHGECVALGMIPVCSQRVRERLLPIFQKLDLPTEFSGEVDTALSFVSRDKKAAEGGIDIVLVEEIGSFKIEKMTAEDFSSLVKKNFK